jgi:hypothetical protein
MGVEGEMKRPEWKRTKAEAESGEASEQEGGREAVETNNV